jgi:hypothetical protein
MKNIQISIILIVAILFFGCVQNPPQVENVDDDNEQIVESQKQNDEPQITITDSGLVNRDDISKDSLFMYNLENSDEVGIIIDPREALFAQGAQNVRGCFNSLVQSDFFIDNNKTLYIYECSDDGCLSMADAIKMNLTNDTDNSHLPLIDMQELIDGFSAKIPYILIEYHRKEGYMFDYDHMVVGLHEYSDPNKCRIEFNE